MVFIIAILFTILTIPARAADSLSYSGRLVKTDGSPVDGPVDLRFEMVYSGNISDPVCTKEFTQADGNAVSLNNGVFHVKLDFTPADCEGKTLKAVLSDVPATPPGQTVALRVVDITGGASKAYSFQEIHSMPFSIMAEMAKTLAPLTAADAGKVLQWNGTQWTPVAMSGGSGTGTGTVTSITAGTGLSGGTITDSGTIAIAAGGVTSTHILDGTITDDDVSSSAGIARTKIASGTAGHIVVNDDTTGVLTSLATLPLSKGGTGATTALGARTTLGLGTAATSNVGTGAGEVAPGSGLVECLPTQRLHFTETGPTWWSCVADLSSDSSKLPLAGGTMAGPINMGGHGITNIVDPVNAQDAATKAYVDSKISDSANSWSEDSGNVYRAIGNVGIGTGTPSNSLHVNSGSTDSVAKFESTDPLARLLIKDDLETAYINIDGTNRFMNLGFGPAMDEGFYIKPGGNVGVGTANPTAKLHLPGGGEEEDSAPLKFTSGSLLTVPEPGAMEFDGTNLYITDSTSTRRVLSFSGGGSGGSYDDVSTISGPGAISVTAGGTDQNLTLSGSGAGLVRSTSPMVITSTSSSTSPLTGAMTVYGGVGISENINAGGSISTGSQFIAPLGTAAAPSYAFNGDIDTGWYSPLADNLAAATGGVERIRITETGNIGIGTTSPNAMGANSNSRVLSISGDGTLTNATGRLELINPRASASIATGDQVGSVAYSMPNNAGGGANVLMAQIMAITDGTGGANGFGGKLLFQTKRDNTAGAASTKMVIDSDGKVGIGTTTPQRKFVVEEATSSARTNTALYNPNTTNNNRVVLSFRTDTTGTNATTFEEVASIASRTTEHDFATRNTDLIFATDDATNGLTTKMIIRGNGNVGIGSDDPTSRLHLPAGTAAASTAPLKFTAGMNLTTPEEGAVEFDGTNLYITDNTATRRTIATSTNGTFTGPLTTSDKVVSPAVYGSNSSAGNLVLDSTTDASKGDIIIAPSGGDVGIGTSTPAGMLSNSSTNVFDQNSVGLGTMGLNWMGISAGYVAAFENKGTGNGFNGVLLRTADTSANSFILNAMSGTESRMAVKADGKVGIGTATPLVQLDVVPVGNYGDIAVSTSGAGSAGFNLITARGATWGGSAQRNWKLTGWSNGHATKANDFQIGFFNGSTYSYPFTILDDTGNVGIGTAEPHRPLTVSSASTALGLVVDTTEDHDSMELYSPSVGVGNTIGLSFRTNDSAANKSILSQITTRLVDRTDGAEKADILFSVADGSGTRNNKMAILSSGNVGVGTINPLQKLEVYDSVNPNVLTLSHATSAANSTGATLGFRNQFSSGSMWVAKIGTETGPAVDSSSLTFSTSSTSNNPQERMRISHSGNVGIGTTTPQAPLHIHQTGLAGLHFTREGYSSSFKVRYSNNGATDTLLFQHSTGEIMSLGNDGNVGIGTTSPQRALHVSSATPTIILERPSASLDLKKRFINTGTSGQMYFGRFSDDLSVSQTHLTVDSVGNVGIGTLNPTSLLHVEKSFAGQSNAHAAFIGATDGGVSNTGVQFIYKNAIGINHNGSYLLNAMMNGTSLFNVTGVGNVGIGVATPSEKLHVAGNILATGTITPSDMRLKKNFKELENPLEKITSLSAVTYDWKDSKKYSEKRQMGVIAQEVKEVFPEAVTETNDGFLAVSYTSLVSPLIGAIKELQKKFVELEKKVDGKKQVQASRSVASLENENRELKEKVSQMEEEQRVMKAYMCKKDPSAPFCRK